MSRSCLASLIYFVVAIAVRNTGPDRRFEEDVRSAAAVACEWMRLGSCPVLLQGLVPKCIFCVYYKET